MADPLFYPASGLQAPRLLTEAEVAAMQPSLPPVGPRARGNGIEVLGFTPAEPTLPAPPPAAARSMGGAVRDTASDVGASIMGGFAGLAEMAGSLYGLLSGDMDNAVRQEGKDARGFWSSLKSDYLKGEEKKRAEAIEKEDGELARLWIAAKLTLTNPALVTSFIGEQAPQLLPIFKAGALGAKVGSVAGLGATGAARAGVGTAIGAGAAMQGADVGSDTFDDVMSAPAEQWQSVPEYHKLIAAGATDQEARTAVALRESRFAAAKGGAATVVTSMLPGARVVERAMVRMPGGGSRLAGAAKGFAGEAASEGLEEGYGRVAVNQGVQAVDPARDTFAGVGEAAGMGAVMGGIFGGVAGASRPKGLLERASEAGGEPPWVAEARDAAWLAGQAGQPALPAPPQHAALPYEQVAQPIGGPTPWPPVPQIDGPQPTGALPMQPAPLALPPPGPTGEIVVNPAGEARPGTTADIAARQQFPNVTTSEDLEVDRATQEFEVMGFAPLRVAADRVPPRTEPVASEQPKGVKTAWDDLPPVREKNDRKALGYNGIQDLINAGGINIESAGELFGETAKRSVNIRPGLFRRLGTGKKKPMGLDEVVTWMSENDYLSERVESGDELAFEEEALNLLRDAILGKRRMLKSADRADDSMADATRAQMESQLRKAEGRGISTRGRSYEQVMGELAALEAADERARKARQAGSEVVPSAAPRETSPAILPEPAKRSTDLSRYSVSVPTVDTNGKRGSTRERADVAVARVDDQLQKAKALLECLKS